MWVQVRGLAAPKAPDGEVLVQNARFVTRSALFVSQMEG